MGREAMRRIGCTKSNVCEKSKSNCMGIYTRCWATKDNEESEDAG